MFAYLLLQQRLANDVINACLMTTFTNSNVDKRFLPSNVRVHLTRCGQLYQG